MGHGKKLKLNTAKGQWKQLVNVKVGCSRNTRIKGVMKRSWGLELCSKVRVPEERSGGHLWKCSLWRLSLWQNTRPWDDYQGQKQLWSGASLSTENKLCVQLKAGQDNWSCSSHLESRRLWLNPRNWTLSYLPVWSLVLLWSDCDCVLVLHSRVRNYWTYFWFYRRSQ